MFLNGKILASEAEKSAYKFELSDQFSGGMIFRFLPKFKLRSLGYFWICNFLREAI
jgi:hypothetical protein